ncbi:MAG: MBL fold metallo-hydrolase [Campylobacteraceae bacterium]|nr:MBL fold metallo-hydrolase [Campylobacteraceae bacterium]
MSDKYKNAHKVYKSHIKELLPMFIDMIKNKSKKSKPKDKNEIPVNFLSKKDIEKMQDYSVIRMGHSTLLFKIQNKYILCDPVFSTRASPFSFLGPKRFHDVPILIKDLPFIDSVIISHDHYDHLDKQSIKALKDKVGTFYTSLGVGKHLENFGVNKNKIVELNWWESKIEDGIEFACTPAQHFSGRTLSDRDKTLWSSWLIKTPKGKFYFGADGGYSSSFKEISSKHGKITMAFLEVGAYNEKWKDIHMMPEDAIQAFKDLKAEVLFPIHNGTFDLSLHSWFEPFDRIFSLAKENSIDIRFPIMGKEISLINHTETSTWWKKAK